MTQWGFALLIAYVALGTSRMTWRNAGRGALLATAQQVNATLLFLNPETSVTIPVPSDATT